MTVFVNLLDLIGLLVAGIILLLFASLFVYERYAGKPTTSVVG